MVNMGLISQLENEAQLAYILCHEIIHFRRKHSMNKYVKLEGNRGELKKKSYEEQLFTRAAYSKEHETQADLEGLDLFLKTGYSTEVLDGVFDVLEYGHLPYDEVEFVCKNYETDNFKFPKSYVLSDCQAISPGETDDTLSTHPSVHKRRALINSKISDSKSKTVKAKYLVGEPQFVKMRQIARQELSRLYIENENYGSSLYNSYLLLKENPKNAFAKEQTLYALYFLAKNRNRGNASVITDYEKVQGKSQAIFHLLNKMSAEETNVLALIYGWKLRTETQKDVVADKICKDLFLDLVDKNSKKPEDFFLSNPDELKNGKKKKQLDSLKTVSQENLSKYEKIKLNNVSTAIKEEVEDTTNTTKYAFAEFYKDPEFLVYFNNAVEIIKKRDADENSEDFRKRRKKERARNERKGYALGIDKTVVVDPDFARIDERRRKAIRYLDAEASRVEFNENVKDLNQKIGFNLDVLSPTSLRGEEIDRFNDYALLNDWISEKLDHDFEYVSLYDRYISELTTRYNTEHFTWMGAVAYTERKKFKVGIVALSLIYPFTTPFAIAYAVTPAHSTYYYCLVFNVKTGNMEMKEVYKIKMADKSYVLRSNIYNSIVQMKSKRRS